MDENRKVHLEKRHNYYYQVQGQLALLNLQWCDFVVWTRSGIHVERITFDRDFWSKQCLPQLKSFYTDVILPSVPQASSHRLKLFHILISLIYLHNINVKIIMCIAIHLTVHGLLQVSRGKYKMQMYDNSYKTRGLEKLVKIVQTKNILSVTEIMVLFLLFFPHVFVQKQFF